MKVSIAIVTYNHEQYIAKTLDSVLMQKTDFDYEIVIGEDCSTDNTRDIIIHYKNRYPDKFILLLNNKNLGLHINGTQTLEASKGEYIAMLDGDDYWTSPDKLQKQVDFLDNHPECSTCFHDSLIVYEDGSKEPTRYRPQQKELSTIEDILMDNYIPTSSVMFRRSLLKRIPGWIGSLKMGDWPVHILNALHGNIGYIDETMAVYVVHPGGVWSMKALFDHDLAIIKMYEVLETHLEPKCAGVINRMLRGRYFYVSGQYENIGDITSARTYASKTITKHLSIISNPWRNRVSPDTACSMPAYITSVTSLKLFNIVLRLYVVPVLRSCGLTILKPYVPLLYKYLRAGCSKALGIFGIRF